MSGLSRSDLSQWHKMELLEPSYVIRKFLDAHKIHHLTEYLQALHTNGIANEDHTTLLLNCYTKLKDKNKLDDFIFKDRENVDFDVDIAIKVCRQSGYLKHALALSEKHAKHEWYLKMQIEDLGGYKDALNYISQLDFEAAKKNMRIYGSSLLNHLPDDTIKLLKALCTDYKAKNAPLISEDMLDGTDHAKVEAASPEQFLHLFVKSSSKMVDFLEDMIKVRGESLSPSVYTTLLEHYMQLYDLEKEPQKKKKVEDKVLSILRSDDASYDEDQVLILCQRHSFRKGALLLFEKKELYSHILRDHVENREIASAIQICRRFGPQDPQLWIKALHYIVKDDTASPGHVSEILASIEKHKLLSPLMVVNNLASSTGACLGILRQYLNRILEAEEKQLKEDKDLITKYLAETKGVRENVVKIRTKAIAFQVSQCSACHESLELPSVHFLCKHSYHQHCFRSFSDSENECPSCAPENKKITEIIESQKRANENHDEFHHNLEKAESSFSVIAEYFGRCMFRKSQDIADLADQVRAASAANGLQLSQRDNLPVVMTLADSLEVGPGAEARLRSSEARVSPVIQPKSEGRLRTEGVSSSSQFERSEGRLRSEQTSLAAKGIPESTARMRLAETHGRSRAASTSPAMNAKHTPGDSKPMTQASINPFGEPDDEEDLDENNPFAETRVSTNPFDSPGNEYDESKNPFSED